MRTSGRRLLVLGAAAGLALALAGAAPTASDTPPAQVFAVSYHDETGTGIAFGVATAGEGPAMAKTTFYVPAGYALDLARAPGSVIGETYAAILTSNGFTSGEGTLRTGDPATLPGDPAAQACAPGPHSAVWIASYKAGTRAGRGPLLRRRDGRRGDSPRRVQARCLFRLAGRNA